MRLSKGWKRAFWICVGVFVALVAGSLLFHLILLFAAGLAMGIVICLLAAVKLRCPHCNKFLFHEFMKVRLHGEIACPGCGKRFEVE